MFGARPARRTTARGRQRSQPTRGPQRTVDRFKSRQSGTVIVDRPGELIDRITGKRRVRFVQEGAAEFEGVKKKRPPQR